MAILRTHRASMLHAHHRSTFHAYHPPSRDVARQRRPSACCQPRLDVACSQAHRTSPRTTSRLAYPSTQTARHGPTPIIPRCTPQRTTAYRASHARKSTPRAATLHSQLCAACCASVTAQRCDPRARNSPPHAADARHSPCAVAPPIGARRALRRTASGAAGQAAHAHAPQAARPPPPGRATHQQSFFAPRRGASAKRAFYPSLPAARSRPNR